MSAEMATDSCRERKYDDSFELELDYEFDAPKFFDFNTPESPSQAQKAERWFLFAQSHSPSPLVIKLRWRTKEVLYGESPTCKSADCQPESPYDVSVSSEDTTPGNGSQKSKAKSQLRPYLPRSSTLLKPTASHLAKLNQLGPSSAKSNGRTRHPGSPLNHSADAITTKRQKLENGYLKKAAQLRHQSSFSHKSSSKVISSNSGSIQLKPEVTVPKGPILETNSRARRYRSVRATFQSNTISNNLFKAQPLNKKIFEAPLLAQPKKSSPCLPEFQEFHLRTMERAMQNSSDNDGSSIKLNPMSPKSSNLANSSDDGVYRFKSQTANRKELKSSGDKNCSHNPPTELFSKLSLASDNQPKSQKQTLPRKELKENLPQSLPPNEITSPTKSSRCNLKHGQYGYPARYTILSAMYARRS